jgi:hypothetical protein
MDSHVQLKPANVNALHSKSPNLADSFTDSTSDT